MPQIHALFWFDTEDCTVPQSDDCAKRLAQILEQYGVTGTVEVVGQKARVFEQRIRSDVSDVLRRHDLGYHSNWHGGRPQTEGGWRSAMLPDGFTAPNLLELAKLGAWTLKPAVLVS